MLENLDLIDKVIDCPIAIFQDENLLYVHNIDDLSLLHEWHELNQRTNNHAVIHSTFLKETLFLSAAFSIDTRSFLLLVLFNKYETYEWTQEDWQKQQRCINAGISILTSPIDFSLELPN